MDNDNNPYKPGAGHMPPYLAGRDKERAEFVSLLNQTTILENMILTGLRGVGKTVLLDTFKPIAIEKKWYWVGTDLSESASISEETIALRVLTDLSIITSDIVISSQVKSGFGFNPAVDIINQTLNYQTLLSVFHTLPGLMTDKLKGTLELVWKCIWDSGICGVIFAYDEAQTMSDHSDKEQYPLSLLLDVFQSIQKKNIPFMLLLTGLPTLFPKLVESRTFAERMFRVVFLDRLSSSASGEAIRVPLENENRIVFNEPLVEQIIKESDGYPYFIQFICKELFDTMLQKELTQFPFEAIIGKLDRDFFDGRWAKATDRQRELLYMIARIQRADEEFTVQEIVGEGKKVLAKPFSASQVTQMLATLFKAGLVYKNRHGKYSFAVPMMGKFILRQSRP